jgi:hypothetical protein
VTSPPRREPATGLFSREEPLEFAEISAFFCRRWYHPKGYTARLFGRMNSTDRDCEYRKECKMGRNSWCCNFWKGNPLNILASAPRSNDWPAGALLTNGEKKLSILVVDLYVMVIGVYIDYADKSC